MLKLDRVFELGQVMVIGSSEHLTGFTESSSPPPEG